MWEKKNPFNLAISAENMFKFRNRLQGNESSEKNDFVEKDNGDYMDYCHRNHLIH
jgi:hypothetical protein